MISFLLNDSRPHSHTIHRIMFKRICSSTGVIAYSHVMFSATLYLDHTLLVYSPPPPTGPFAGYLPLFLMKEETYFIHYVTNTFQVVFSISYNLFHSFFKFTDFCSTLLQFYNILLWLHGTAIRFARSFYPLFWPCILCIFHILSCYKAQSHSPVGSFLSSPIDLPSEACCLPAGGRAGRLPGCCAADTPVLPTFLYQRNPMQD